MPVTMRDVAAEAGVSIRTVSRVVNKQGEISEATRQRVLNVIRQMGYRPNLLARGLVTQQTYTIGLVIADITNPFFATVVSGIQEIARQHGYNLFVCNNNMDPEEEEHLLRSLVAQRVDGVILFPLYNSKINTILEVAEHSCPVVVINAEIEHPNLTMVLIDLYGGGVAAMEHLIQQGHREIAMLAGGYIEPFLARGHRTAAYRDTLSAHGIAIKEAFIRIGGGTIEAGYAATLTLLTEHPEITAIYAYNDIVAAGAMKACRELGRQIPDECSIVGFDDIPLACLITPSLSTVHIDQRNLGQQAMKQMLQMLDNPQEPVSPVHMDVKLIIRSSS